DHPWSWWSSLVRTPSDLQYELQKALVARRKRCAARALAAKSAAARVARANRLAASAAAAAAKAAAAASAATSGPVRVRISPAPQQASAGAGESLPRRRVECRGVRPLHAAPPP